MFPLVEPEMIGLRTLRDNPYSEEIALLHEQGLDCTEPMQVWCMMRNDGSPLMMGTPMPLVWIPKRDQSPRFRVAGSGFAIEENMPQLQPTDFPVQVTLMVQWGEMDSSSTSTTLCFVILKPQGLNTSNKCEFGQSECWTHPSQPVAHSLSSDFSG